MKVVDQAIAMCCAGSEGSYLQVLVALIINKERPLSPGSKGAPCFGDRHARDFWNVAQSIDFLKLYLTIIHT